MDKITLHPDPYYPIREDLHGALERYVNDGIDPGGFLTACLENDMFGVYSRADSENVRNIRNIIHYIYHHLPSACWGSPEKMRAWREYLREEKSDE